MTAGDLRKEVWSRPGSNPFERIDIEPPGPFNFTKRAAGGIGQGQITVPTTYERINDLIRRVPGDPGIDVRRLVRVYAEGVTLPVYEFFLDVTGDETGEGNVTIEGAGVESFMSDGTVAPWDWDGQDESTSTFPDWVWGGKELVGPVETTFIPHIIRVWNLATGGTMALEISVNGGPYQTVGFAWNESAFTLEQAIESVIGITVDVSGFGTATNPWEIRILAPAGKYVTAINGAGLSGPVNVAFIELEQFGKLLPIGWTESRIGSTDVAHGFLLDFRASLGGGADPALPADCSAWITFNGTDFFYPGVQKIIKVNPGSINQIPPLYLYAQGANAEVAIVIRDLNENLIAVERLTLISNTLTQTVGLQNVMIPPGITEIVFRLGHIGPGDPPPIFMACPSMREGLIPTSAGGIFTQLFQDATVNHVFDGRIVWENLAASGTSYLDLSFTTAVDSAGVGWDNMAMDFTATRGKTYLQVLTDLGSRGYRWSVTPSNTAGRWQVNLYNNAWVKVDATLLQTPAINVGSGVTSGPIYRSHLVGNAVTVEGQQMKFGRFESATSIASIGRREIYQPDKTLTTNAAATIRAAEEVASRLLSGLSVSLNIEPVDSPIPLHAYDVDWNVNVQVPPVLPKSAHRISAITATVTETGTSYKAAFSSEAFAGGQGVIEGVRRLLLKFEGLDPPEPDALQTPISSGGGGAPTVVVAAADSTQYSKDRADWVCTGVNDAGTIQLAINAVRTLFGRVILCEGNYNIDTAGGQSAITVWAGVSLLGLGMEKTYILVDSHSGAGTAIMVESQGNGYIRDLAFWNNTDSDITAIKLAANWGNLDVTRVRFDCDGRMIDTAGGNNNCVVAECILANGDFNLAEPQIRLDACRRWVIRDNEGFSGRNFVRIENDCTDINIHDNYAEQIGEEAIICQPGAGSHAGQAIKIHHNSLLISGASGLFSAILIDTTGIITTSALSFHIDNNIIDGPIKYGIELIDAHHVRMFGNTIEEAGRHGIFLDASSDCMLHDNYVWQASQETDNTYDGIFLQGDSNDNSIQANKFIKHTGATPRTRYCVNVSAAACDRTVVVSNQMRGGYQTAAINNAGTGTIITYPGGGAGIGDNFV